MKLILILAGPYTTCLATKATWQDACARHQLKLDVTHLEEKAGEALAVKYNLNTFPALIADGKVAAVGHPDEHAAEKIISQLLEPIKSTRADN